MSESSEPLTDAEKLTIVSDLMKQTPPGEFKEVFTDLRAILENDDLMKKASKTFLEYHTEQFTPTTVGKDKVLVTEFGADGSRFVDPRNRTSFKYDPLQQEASDLKKASVDKKAEPFRAALDEAVSSYAEDHYPSGVVTVYGSSKGGAILLTVCIEGHKFSPQNFWNGKWKSQWQADLKSGDVKGVLKVQVHYYEDGNVMLALNKDVNIKIKTSSKPDECAKAILKVIASSETDYQNAIDETYQTMNQSTLKVFRRALPVTRSKIDWDKVLYQNVAAELKH